MRISNSFYIITLVLCFFLSFATKAEESSFFNQKIEEGALSSNAAMREGTQHMLSTFKKNPKKYTPENIEHIDMKFEKGLDDICANCRYDVKFREGQKPLYEGFKSYNTETWGKIANDKGFIKQFESYLQEVDEIKDLAYVINSNKANIN